MPRYRRPLAELSTPVVCRCGQQTEEPRRSLCPRCYWRARRAGELDEAPACIDCGEDDSTVLVGTRDGVRCLNCRAKAQHERLTA